MVPQSACPDERLFCHPVMHLHGISNVRAAVRLKTVNPLIVAKEPVEPTKASPRSGPCDLAWSSPALRPGMFFAGIASADAFRRLASIN